MEKPVDPYADWLSIPTAQRPLNNYQLLGVGPFESRAELIEQAADRQIERLQKFMQGEQRLVAKRVMFELESAKLCLLDPEKKRTYDAALQEPTGAVRHTEGGARATVREAAAPPLPPITVLSPGTPLGPPSSAEVRLGFPSIVDDSAW